MSLPPPEQRAFPPSSVVSLFFEDKIHVFVCFAPYFLSHSRTGETTWGISISRLLFRKHFKLVLNIVLCYQNRIRKIAS